MVKLEKILNNTDFQFQVHIQNKRPIAGNATKPCCSLQTVMQNKKLVTKILRHEFDSRLSHEM